MGGGKDISGRRRISVQADRQGGGETDGWQWREGKREGQICAGKGVRV